jgi:methylated-DNA-protein-cysteine methyltransferase-like protein
VTKGLFSPVACSRSPSYIFTVKQRREKKTYLRIWRTVLRIPKGKVASYGRIAALSGFPRQGRLAGYALHNLPVGSDIPWHRVINARGKISLPGKRGEEQGRLLREEWIAFVGGMIDMKKYEWRPVRVKKKSEFKRELT